LFFTRSASGQKQPEMVKGTGTEAGGGWQGASESAVSAKVVLVFTLARNRRLPKRPSEPRPSGAHLEEDEVGK